MQGAGETRTWMRFTPSPLGTGQCVCQPVRRLLDASDPTLLMARRHRGQAITPYAVFTGLRNRWLGILPRG